MATIAAPAMNASRAPTLHSNSTTMFSSRQHSFGTSKLYRTQRHAAAVPVQEPYSGNIASPRFRHFAAYARRVEVKSPSVNESHWKEVGAEALGTDRSWQRG